MLFTDSYGEQSLHRRPLVVHHRAERLPHRPVQGRHSRRAGRHEREDRDDRRAAEGAGLRHRPVRQEPSRRPQPHAADQSRLRRVLRQPLSPQCRGRAGDVRLSAGEGLPELPARTSVRAASSTPGRPTRTTPTVEPRWGKVGKQKIEDTGPLTKKRMETCDDEFVAAAKDFIKRQNKDGKPFFVWLNTTHMHLFTHTKKESLGQAGRWQSPYHDTMIDHDKNVGADARPARRARHRRRHLRRCTRPTTGRIATRGRTAA